MSMHFKFLAAFMAAQLGLCRTWSEIQIVGFLMQRLIRYFVQYAVNNNDLDQILLVCRQLCAWLFICKSIISTLTAIS